MVTDSLHVVASAVFGGLVLGVGCVLLRWLGGLGSSREGGE